MPKRKLPWDKIRQEYIYTSATIRSIAAKYGCSKRSVDRHSVLEGWVELRRREMTDIGQEAHTRIREAAIIDRVSLYDSTREAAQNIVLALLEASQDPMLIRRHIIPMEKTTGSGESRECEKWVEDREMKTVNGKNASDIAKAIKDLASMARVLDGIIEAPVKARLDIEREKLELDRRKAGMSDDEENETGIAYMPEQDLSLLENALPDPDQPYIS